MTEIAKTALEYRGRIALALIAVAAGLIGFHVIDQDVFLAVMGVVGGLWSLTEYQVRTSKSTPEE